MTITKNITQRYWHRLTCVQDIAQLSWFHPLEGTTCSFPPRIGVNGPDLGAAPPSSQTAQINIWFGKNTLTVLCAVN